jgi:hypothetical protein
MRGRIEAFRAQPPELGPHDALRDALGAAYVRPTSAPAAAAPDRRSRQRAAAVDTLPQTR